MAYYVTKLVEADASPHKSSETIVAVYGSPSVSITYQGRAICKNLNDKFCKQFGIDHRIASAYHPQTGDDTERLNSTFMWHVCALCRFVAENLLTYRTSKHESTKQTPFHLVFGRHARLPVELDISTQQKEVDEDCKALVNQRIDSLINLLHKGEQASSNIKTA